MKGFLLDADTGDLVVRDGGFALAEGDELLAQNIRMLVGTNRGEWWLNRGEGVDFKAILCKQPNFDLVQNQIQSALLAVDPALLVRDFSHNLEDRRLTLRFTAAHRDKGAVQVAARIG